MNPRLLIIILFLIIASETKAQSTTEKQKIDQTITWLKQVSSISVEWTNNPEKKEYRKQLEVLVKSFDKIKEDITLVYVARQAKAEGIAVIGLLDEIHAASQEILTNLHDDKSLDDAVSVMLSQETAETRIVPSSKKLVDSLSGL